MIDRPKLETIFKLDTNPVPLNVIDFNVMAHAVLHWYESKIEGSFSAEVEEKLIKGAWALAVNRGPDMLPRHTYRIIFIADQRYADTGNYWRDRFMSESPIVQRAWESYAETKKIKLSQTPTNYKGQRGPKSDAFWRVYNVGRTYATEYYPFFEAEGFEADDWAGVIYRLSRDSSADSLVRKRQILLNTLDRDWSQLVDEDHKVYFANCRVPFPNEKIQERLVGNQGVIDHTLHKMGFNLDHPKNLADWKVKHGDMGDNLPPGSPKCLFDLCETNPDYCIERTSDRYEDFIETLNEPKANDRPDHFEQSLRAFAKICLEAPVKL
jgi:hypothetical protein